MATTEELRSGQTVNIFWKHEPTEIANMKWRGVEDDSKVFGLRNWKDRVAIKIAVVRADTDWVLTTVCAKCPYMHDHI